ncbi:major facilitator superfamily domain-containing protein [Tricladium varicosporioides]|nr:major facilitator superfamily domain-containing protein [Hymenoscyphus varicosporioides]
MGFTKKQNVLGPVDPEIAAEWARTIAAWSPEERKRKEKALVRHIDRRLLPMLILMYILNYVDRNALPAARIQGLETDLGLKGVEYNTALSVLFAGYILAQVPSNMILGLTRPSIYLPSCMLVWGVVSGCSGAVQNYAGLVVCRFFLGIAEAPFFAGTAFLFSAWYTQRELGVRLGIFFCGAMLSGAFAGLFAAGIAAAFKNNRIASWRWLFIIEGAATVVVSLIAMYVIPNWPATTKWLSEEERQLSIARMLEDAGEEEEDISPRRGFFMAIKDYRLWLVVVGQTCVQAVASLTNFLPTIVKNFGYGTIESLLLTAPPYILAAGFCVFNTWYSDRSNVRSLHMIFPLCFTVAGIIITLTTTNTGALYFAVMLMVPATYGCFQVSNAWASSVAPRPRQKRAVALALNNSIGNTALIWTPYLYPKSQGPRYRTAWSVNLTLAVVGILSSIALRLILQRENRKLDRDNIGAIQVEDEEQKTGSNVLESEFADVTAPGGATITQLGGRNEGKSYRYQI